MLSRTCKTCTYVLATKQNYLNSKLSINSAETTPFLLQIKIKEIQIKICEFQIKMSEI